MKKILIFKEVVPMGEYDLFTKIERENMDEIINKFYGKKCFNVGNKLWLQGIYSSIRKNNIDFVFYNSSMTHDYINNNFNLIVLPMANIFNIEYVDAIKGMTKFFENIKIPTFVIACGVQADSYNDLDKVVNLIGNVATKFINTIYKTGGQFALRGNFTNDFFKKLGFNNAVVLGCPSMFQMGRNLTIINNKVPKEKFKVVCNGNLKMMSKFNSDNFIFIDQDNFFYWLYDKESVKNYNNFCKSFLKQYSIDELQLLLDKKIKLFFDLNVWANFLKNNNYTFVFGTRIHGNIMPLLNGIPSVVYAWDSRTREMAEYFNIPHITDEKFENKNSKFPKDLYDLYMNADFADFNNSFAEKYDKFEKFLIDNKIIDTCSQTNTFFYAVNSNSYTYTMPNEKYFDDIKNFYFHNKLKLQLYSYIERIKKKIYEL